MGGLQPAKRVKLKAPVNTLRVARLLVFFTFEMLTTQAKC